MLRFFRLLFLLCLPFIIGAAPDTFTREELEALEREKLAAEQELAALQAAGSGAALDFATLNESLIA